jgi:chromosome segregation ATPase
VFIKDGEPTDAFLEAMQRDLGSGFMDFNSIVNFNDLKIGCTEATKSPLRKQVDPKKKKMKAKSESRDLAISKSTENVSKISNRVGPSEIQILSTDFEMQSNIAENNNIILEQQSFIKSLQLRLTGTLGTVKHLQASLKQANSQIDDQRCSIAKLNFKLKLVADKGPQIKNNADDERHIDFLVKEIDELKKKLSTAELRIDEEALEKMRWEERCRNWRQCAEQSKQKLQAVENSIGSRLQTQSKKNDKSSRREAVKRDEESKELKCRIEEYKAKLEQEEIRCEEYLSRLSKTNQVVLQLKEESRHQNIEIHNLRQLVKDHELQLQVATRKERVNLAADNLPHKPTSSIIIPKAGLQASCDGNFAKSQSVVQVQQSPQHRKTVPLKILTAATKQVDRLSSSLSEAVDEVQDNLILPKPSTMKQPSLHTDTVALIKSIAARTIHSLPSNNTGFAEIKVPSYLLR